MHMDCACSPSISSYWYANPVSMTTNTFLTFTPVSLEAVLYLEQVRQHVFSDWLV
jgi:hypothetical protein